MTTFLIFVLCFGTWLVYRAISSTREEARRLQSARDLQEYRAANPERF